MITNNDNQSNADQETQFPDALKIESRNEKEEAVQRGRKQMKDGKRNGIDLLVT